MNSLNYSPLATNALPLFDKSVNTIRILVEGVDDIPFWTNLFESLLPVNSKYKVLCEQKQGCKEVCKNIISNGISQKFICALDSEYDEIIHDKEKYKNSYTVFTIRHSIENFLFCPMSLINLLKKLNLDYTTDISNDCNIYIKELCQSLELLLFLDCKKQIRPELFPLGTKILGSDKSIASLSENNKYIPNRDKIRNFINNNKLDKIDISDMKEKFKNKNIYYFLNGHFISHSIYTFLSSKTKRKGTKIGKTNLYTYLYDYCSNCKNKCPDYKNIESKASLIIQNFINA